MTNDLDPNDDIDRISISIDDVAVPPAPPRIGDDDAAVLAEALDSLGLMRFPLSLGDGTAELHCLGSLLEQAKARIPGAVAEARDQDHSWEEIATCLGISPSAARHRFAAHARTSARSPLED